MQHEIYDMITGGVCHNSKLFHLSEIMSGPEKGLNIHLQGKTLKDWYCGNRFCPMDQSALTAFIALIASISQNTLNAVIAQWKHGGN